MKTNRLRFYFLKREIDELSLDPVTRLGLRLGFAAIGLQLIILALSWHRLPPQAPLLYSHAYGATQLVDSLWLWLLPLLTLVIELISIRLAVKAGKENPLWSQLLSWVGTLSAAMTLITLTRIISLLV